jgi:hypothetical protein
MQRRLYAAIWRHSAIPQTRERRYNFDPRFISNSGRGDEVAQQ